MKHLKCVKILLIICLWMVSAITVSAAKQTNYKENIQEIITEVAEEYEIAPSLILAMAQVESNMNPRAVSKTGDYGLMQINKVNHEWLEKELGITDWFDVRQNVEAACYIVNWLRYNYEECQDVYCCLMAYNMGVGNARKLWNKGIYESEYCDKIFELEYEIGRRLENVEMQDSI